MNLKYQKKDMWYNHYSRSRNQPTFVRHDTMQFLRMVIHHWNALWNMVCFMFENLGRDKELFFCNEKGVGKCRYLNIRTILRMSRTQKWVHGNSFLTKYVKNVLMCIIVQLFFFFLMPTFFTDNLIFKKNAISFYFCLD